MYVIRADQLLTMPQDTDRLTDFDPDGDLQSRDDELVGLIEDGAVVVDENTETIDWVGPFDDRPDHATGGDVRTIDVDLATPGWIDCHTHAVFAGERSDEFMWRNAGREYVEILEAGGGILNTVDAVRAASTDELTESLIRRVYESVRQGITTLEVKSGYGLTTSDEIKSLKAVDAADDEVPCELTGCFLGAHAIPRNFRDSRDDYVDMVCDEMIPEVADRELAAYCDVFCDRGAFTVDEARRILEVGKDHGLVPRIHAEEIAATGAAKMAAELGAASADHLEHIDDDTIQAMAEAGTVGVLMPAVNLFLDTVDELAPARDLLNANCEVALATDFNPGSAMTQNLGTILMLGCTLYGLTPGEALRSITAGAAKALRRDDIGTLKPGTRADIACFAAPHYRYIPYHFGQSHAVAVIHRGEPVYWTEETVSQ